MIFASIDLNRGSLEGFLESLEEIKGSKFNGVEICLWGDMAQHSIKIRDTLSITGLQANVHNDLMKIEQGINDCERKLRCALRFKKDIGAKFFVSHPIKPYLPNMARTKELFKKVEEEILLENVKGIKLQETQFFGMPLALDIGNLAKNGEYKQMNSYDNVKWVHIHDYKDGQDHLPLGEGSLDLSQVVNAFRGKGFTIELGSKFRKWKELRKDYRRSIDWLNNVLISNESYGKNVRLEHLFRHTKKDKFDVVVDFGCGDGYLLHNVNAKIKRGYDLSPRVVFNDLVYVKQDITIPFQECTDLVICSEVIEHLAEDSKALKNIYNALRSGGRIFLTTINKNTSKDKSKLDRERLHFKRYGEELRKIMEIQGFTTISFYPFRSKHYYEHKGDFAAYCLEADIIQGKKDASGWVYFGVKGGKR